MLEHLVSIAKRQGIAGFTAEVLPQNKVMQALLQKSGCEVRSRLREGVYSYELDFA